jgi:hypothetical protein
MKREIAGLKSRADRYEADVRSIFATMRDMKTGLQRVAVTTTNTAASLEEFKAYALNHFVTRGEFHDRMDGFATRLEVLELRMAHQKERVDDLERGSGS